MSSEYTFRVLTGEDWEDYNENNLAYEEGLKLVSEKDGHYSSKPLDSGITDCRWHRVVIDADIPDNSMLTISFSTSEDKAKTGSWSEPIVFQKARDALIQVEPGQYIALRIEFHQDGEAPPVLRQVTIYYQRLSYLRYLPAVYQENSEGSEFLERFLSIFESALYDSEEMIASMPVHFDPMAASEEFYKWLAGWLSLDLYELLEDRNRKFILRAAKLYEQKGTIPGLVSLVSFLTGGKKVLIKEYMNNVFRSYGMEHKETDEPVDGLRCENSYHTTSRTVDTSKPGLLAKMGRYDDTMHYVVDTSEEGTYHPHVIGLYIFVPAYEGLLIREDQLLKIILSFLPVFVRIKINFIEVYDEFYDLNSICEKYEDVVHGFTGEQVSVQGEYRDGVNWGWLCSYTDGEEGITNEWKYRTPHTKIDDYESYCKKKKKVTWLGL